MGIVAHRMCTVSKVGINSLAFKWINILRLGIKMHNQVHQVLKNVFATSWKYA